jgi:predicted dehydrogenase
MEDNNKVKFAVIGYGHIGKRHAEMISRNPDCELAAIADVNGDALAEGTDSAIPGFGSLEEMFDSGIRVDVANIATPNGFHASQAIQCLEHGLHVVIEKPMALNKQDAEAIIFKALQQHRNVFVVMQNRFSPPSVWMKEMIEKQRLGRIFLVQINCYWNRDARYYRPGGWHGTADLDGGTLFTQFSHFIDIMYWLFGDISNIRASFADFNHEGLTAFEDTGMLCFDFVRGG